MPRIDPLIINCVVYLYRSVAEAKAGEKIGGSGFLVGVPSPLDLGHHYLFAVTNRHVAFEAAAPVIRLNTKAGGVDILDLDVTNWTPHPDGDDIVIASVGLNSDHHDFSFISESRFFTREIIEKHDIGPGDDAFMVGRFINHEGKQKNLPSVRFGNIAMMPWEPIEHPIYKRPQDSFAVEMRSIGGYSGSPVFVHIPPLVLRPKSSGISTSSLPPGLIGVDWGHIHSKEPVRNKFGEPMPEKWYVNSNSGMIGVVPAWKLSELLHLPEFDEVRMKNDEMIRDRKAKEPAGFDLDVSKQEPPTTDESPRHKEDFNSLLDAAARGKQSDDQT